MSFDRLFVKKECKECGKKFDCGINLNVCPECRMKKMVKDKWKRL